MSPPPVRVETNASRGRPASRAARVSVAGCDTSRRASPPAAGTVQMSPPETKAISRPSGESEGSASAAWGHGCWCLAVRGVTGDEQKARRNRESHRTNLHGGKHNSRLR